ncbi:MAG: hypothetical protein EOL90_08260 [Spartobacteria bacterium]|nr:hypothetical protein [Spartobacteria bacterium]
MRERKRIWTTGATVNEWRELCSIGSNEFGDVLLTLDGGEVWQFTPHKPLENTPRIDEVTHAGIMRDSKTNIPTSLAYMILQEPRRELHGNIRVLPREQQAVLMPKPSPNPKGREPEYDPKEDARIFDLYKAQPERISIETFREENPKIKQDYTLRELRRLIDRERKRRNAGLAKKALKRNKRQ